MSFDRQGKTWDFLECAYRKETEKAVLVEPYDGDAEVWIPKSLIGNLEEFTNGTDADLEVEAWWLEQENLA